MDKRQESPARARRPDRRRTVHLPVAVLLVGLASSVALWRLLLDQEERFVESRFRLDTEERAIGIREQLADDLGSLQFLSSLYDVHPDVTRDVFAEFVRPILERRPTIQGFGWNPRVVAAERDAHEAAGRLDFPTYAITQRAPDGMVPATERPEYVVVHYLEPYAGNESALGFDVASEPRRLAALSNARDTGKLVSTARIDLVQGEHGFLAFLPRYRRDAPTETLEDRRANVEGYLVGVFRIGDIVESALADLDGLAIDVTLLDADAPDDPLLYDTRLRSGVGREVERAGDQRRTVPLACGERNWSLVFRPTEEYLAGLRSRTPLGALLAGLMITVLFASYLTALRKRTERIEEVMRAEEEQRRLEHHVQHAQRLEGLEILAGGIAHDFNNLLMCVLGNADLALRKQGPGTTVRHELTQISLAATQAADLVRSMLTYAGKGRHVVEPIDLSQLLGEMAGVLRVSISKSAELRCELDPGLAAVEGDASQLRQVCMNLITNASDALEDQPGTIVVRTSTVKADRRELDGMLLGNDLAPGFYVCAEVTDTGCGMTAETSARIFDPFFTTKFQGRGLGLAAVLGIVRGHGGAIRLDSTPGVGTRVRVLLPASRAQVPGKGEETRDALGAAERAGFVLIVDDEDGVREVASGMVEEMGLHALPAADGVEALELVEKHADDVLVVVLDLTMPRMDGRETLRELRRLRPDLPVIISSGYQEAEDVAERGVAGFLKKPYVSSELHAKIRAAVASRTDDTRPARPLAARK